MKEKENEDARCGEYHVKLNEWPLALGLRIENNAHLKEGCVIGEGRAPC